MFFFLPVRVSVAVVVAQQVLLGELLVLGDLERLVDVREQVLRDLGNELQEALFVRSRVGVVFGGRTKPRKSQKERTNPIERVRRKGGFTSR